MARVPCQTMGTEPSNYTGDVIREGLRHAVKLKISREGMRFYDRVPFTTGYRSKPDAEMASGESAWEPEIGFHAYSRK